jgi:hypothetical protein
MIYSQVPYYIILAAGFVIYIVWGVVLSFIVTAHNNLNPVRFAFKTINYQLGDLQKRLKEIAGKLLANENMKTSLQANMKKLNNDLDQIRFNRENFEHRVTDFMNGWHSWIDQGFPYEKHVRQAEAEREKNEVVAFLYQKNLVSNADPK